VRVGLIVLAVLLVLVGLVWIGQGLGYIKGSFMTGDTKWFAIGIAMVVVGAGIGFGALRQRRGQSRV